MDQKVKSYSLVSVLVAMIILMAALVPLITLQGRFFNHIQAWNQTAELIDIEELYQVMQKEPVTTEDKRNGDQIERKDNGLLHIKFRHRDEMIHGFIFQVRDR